MKHLNVVRYAAVALLLSSGVVHAQYVWVDSKGGKQFSDRPPPPGTPARNILKTPAAPVPSDTVEPAAVPAGAGATGAAPPTLAEREADYRKRTADKAGQDAKLAEQARVATHNAQACAAARAIAAQLATGERVTVAGKNGERIVINDAQRAQRSAQAAQVLGACK